MAAKKAKVGSRKRGPAYRVRPGAHINQKTAAAVGPIVVRLARTGGAAEDLLEEASDPSSPAHAAFNWNDAEAAHAHRLEQARYYWRSFEIVIEDRNEKVHAVRQFHVVTEDDGERKYRDIRRIRENEDLMAQVLVDAKRQLAAWYAKYSTLSQMAEMRSLFTEIEKVIRP